jgi:hypothetical protein
MENNTKWIAFVMLIILALGYEATRMSAPTLKKKHEGLADYLKPYAVSAAEVAAIPHTASMLPQVEIVHPETVNNFDLAGMAKKAEAETAKTKAAEAAKKTVKGWHWVWNKKTQKWVWKKVIDKKKETAVAGVEVPQTVTPPVAPQVPSFDPNAQGLGGAGEPTPPNNNFGGAAAPVAQSFKTLAEWEALLLGTPSTSETTTFVNDYKQHLVTSTVFYQIIGMMLKDSRTTMQAQGILAAGLTPSVQSFEVLAGEQTTLQTSSTLLTSVNGYLAVYGQTSNLSTLQSVMSSSTTASVLQVAEQTLQTSMSTNSTNLAAYSGFSAVLTTLASNSNSSVSSLANSLLSSLRNQSVATN